MELYEETDFINDVTSKSKIILSIGLKASGKSYTLLNTLRMLYEFNIYDKYVLVIPVIEGEQNDSYEFIFKHKNNTIIYKKYGPEVSKKVNELRKKHSVFYAIDDASQEFLNKPLDYDFTNIISTSRHFKGCCIYLNVHSCRGVLKPFLRQNTDILILYKCSNHKLLETLHEEYFSMNYDSIKSFMNDYRSHILNTNHNGVIYKISDNKINWNVKDFQINNTF